MKEKDPLAFTVDASGKQVKFAPGNLYWDGSEFKFEEHQYDYPTSWDASHVGHFFWSKDERVAYSNNYSTANTTYGITSAKTDTFFAADGGVFEGFTVLSKDEWSYLFINALAKNSSSNYTITIDGKSCIVLKPDGFSGSVADSYTVDAWATAESTSGLVALPFAGYYYGSSIISAGSSGYYWSSTPDSSDAGYAWYPYFDSDDAYTGYFDRDYGRSVRLVQVVE